MGLAGERLDDGPACGQRGSGLSPSKCQVAGVVFDDFWRGIPVEEAPQGNFSNIFSRFLGPQGGPASGRLDHGSITLWGGCASSRLDHDYTMGGVMSVLKERTRVTSPNQAPTRILSIFSDFSGLEGRYWVKVG